MQNRSRSVLVAAAAMCLLSAACTHRPFHPTKTDRDWTVDHEACEVSVRKEVRDEPEIYDAMDEIKMIKACMKAKGWRWKRIGLFESKHPVEE